MDEEVVVQPPRVHFSSPAATYNTENGVTVKRWTPSEEYQERAVDAGQLESPSEDIGFSPPLTTASQSSWFDGIFGCMRPVLGNLIGKARTDDWEIPFESIKDLQWLGSGAQGAVFKGRLRGQVVAVKKVKDKQETEIRHLKQLQHPNIIRFLGICTQAPCYAIVMEYCSKGTLHDYLRKTDDITPVQTLEWAVQIATGMAFLHSKNIIHRDLKSPNVLLSNDNKLKISDFGTSRVWSEASAEMSFIGTYAWMAPEIIRKELCSEKVDVWSYGVVLWELVTGETPYRGLETARILFGVGNNSLSLPLPATLPPGLHFLMKMCWESKPRNRPSFESIRLHLSIAAPELINRDPKQFCEERVAWRLEIAEKLHTMGYASRNEKNASKELLKKRKEEMKHAAEIRAHYEIKMAMANQLVLQLAKIKRELEERDIELARRERLLGTLANGSPGGRSISRLSKKNNWRFGLKRRSAQDSAISLPVDPVSRSSTLPARLEKPHIPMTSQRAPRRVPIYVELEDPQRSLLDLIKRPFQSNSSIPTISELTQYSTTRPRVDITDMRGNNSDTDTDRSSTDIDDENANDIDIAKIDKNGNSRDSLDDLNKTVQELGRWERVRGRASGSSKNGSGRYKDNYIAATRYSGRYCTIDVSQYSRSVKHEYMQEDVMSKSFTTDVQVPGDKGVEARNGSSQEGFSSSNWETCSEEDLGPQLATVPASDVTLRRESVARHPVQRVKRPSSIISSQSLPVERLNITDDIAMQLNDATVTECEL